MLKQTRFEISDVQTTQRATCKFIVYKRTFRSSILRFILRLISRYLKINLLWIRSLIVWGLHGTYFSRTRIISRSSWALYWFNMALHSAKVRLINWATSQLTSGVVWLSIRNRRTTSSCGPKRTRTSNGYSSSFNFLCSKRTWKCKFAFFSRHVHYMYNNFTHLRCLWRRIEQNCAPRCPLCTFPALGWWLPGCLRATWPTRSSGCRGEE